MIDTAKYRSRVMVCGKLPPANWEGHQAVLTLCDEVDRLKAEIFKLETTRWKLFKRLFRRK